MVAAMLGANYGPCALSATLAPMPHRIEPAPSGRAGCRGCKAPIAKGALRFAEEFQSPYSEDGAPAFRYWHLQCAAEKLANEVSAALTTYHGQVEDRAAIEAAIAAHLRPEMPYAERAGTGRARCRACDVTIKKGELRVAFERVFDSPMGPQKGAAYAHIKCVPLYLEREKERGRDAMALGDLVRLVLAHSKLESGDGELVANELAIASS
jgi:Poly(ADP-ribose) polymerase and DNA-Ligase Zn-finger region